MTMNFDEAREGLRRATTAIRDAEDAYRKAVDASADAEAIYRAKLAEAMTAHRANGTAVAESDTLARADSIVYSRERDAMAGRAKLAAEVLEDRRDDRRSLWRLIEWSAKKDTGASTNGDLYAADAAVAS